MEKRDIKDKILREISMVEEKISGYREKTRPIAPDKAIGRISRMDAIISKSVMESSLRQAEERLKKLRHALAKVETPDFGVCIKCGTTIPIGRIIIIPESPYCVNCAK